MWEGVASKSLSCERAEEWCCSARRRLHWGSAGTGTVVFFKFEAVADGSEVDVDAEVGCLRGAWGLGRGSHDSIELL